MAYDGKLQIRKDANLDLRGLFLLQMVFQNIYIK